jgi:branched-chain amino acid transport system substrate-binding protein
MREKIFMVLMAGFIAMFLFCPSLLSAQEKEPIRIGMISPLSGTYAQPGVDMQNGAIFYLEKIGYKMAGRKVEIIVEDEEASPSVALTKARKLVELNKINVLVGPLLTNSAYAVGPYQESKKMPTLIFSAADDLTQRKRGNWSVRVAMSCSQPMHPFGEYAYKVLGLRKVAVVAADYAFGWEVVGGFQKTFEDAGGKILQKIWYPINAADFSPYLTQIHKEAEAMFSMFGGKSAIVLNKQFQEYGLKSKMLSIGLAQIADESILPTMGDEAIGIITGGNYSGVLDTPINKELVKGYREKYGKVPSLFSEMSYDCIHAIDQAVTSLKGDVRNPEKLMKALKTVDLKETPRGPIKMDAYGNAIQNIYVRKVERIGGQLQNTVIYTYPEVSQFWKYKPEEFLKQPTYSRDYPPLKP